MLRNFFKTATRNLSKNKFFTVLNILALALGMSVSLLFIALFTFILQHDDFHPFRSRIYRVTTKIHQDDNPEYASAPVGLAQKLKEDFTGIEKVVRIEGSLRGEAVYHEKKIALNGYFTEPDFLKIFNFPLLQGNIATALASPNTIVISETEARKIFVNKNALGEMIHVEPYGEFLITGVFKDVPKNSHMQFGALASYTTLLSLQGSSFLEDEAGWTDFRNSYVYLLLAEHSDPSRIDLYLNEVAREKYAKQNFKTTFKLQPLIDIVPGPNLLNAIGPSWDWLNIIIVGSLSMLILVPACSNYINLSISQSLNRVKEIGVRKVMGGQRSQLYLQFITESTVMMFLALALSYLIYETVRVDFLELMAEAETMDLAPHWYTFLGFILFAVLLGCIAGAVPAFYFSRISPVSALKGKLAKAANANRFSIRKTMITAQFALSLGFIMAVVIMMQQYRYSVNYNLGFQQENILDVELQGANPQLFKNEFGNQSSVLGISMSSDILGLGSSSTHYLKTLPESDSIEASSISIDENFISNLKLQLLSGKNFSNHPGENSNMIIVNEEFVKKLNLMNSVTALETSLILPDGREARIGGVVKNFHYESLRTPIKSFFFEYRPDQFRYANLNIQSTDIIRDRAAMEATWKKMGREEIFQAQFFSDEINDAYSFYFIVIRLWSFLGLLAIAVACLGLLGTVVFTIKNRTKEVSIRKVMGASSESVVVLLSRDFIMLMVIATVITVPVIYFLFNYLLLSIQHYSVEIGFIEIVGSVLIMSILCLTTIFSQTLKAANANPVDNLRME